MSSSDSALHRSHLYAPGSSPRVMRKALAAGADAVILDLEDAVVSDAKDFSRAEVSALLDEVAADPAVTTSEVSVRINRSDYGYLRDDLEAVVRPGLAGIRLPKVESAEAVRGVDNLLTELERRHDLDPRRIHLTLTVESALGAVSIASLATASPRVVRFAIGTADLLADLGAVGDDDLATLHVRSELVLHSRAAGLAPPVDSVYTDLEDDAGLAAAARRARALGFYGKSVVHPRQLDVVHEVFTPTDAEVSRAERIVDAAGKADRSGRGAVVVDGGFVDAAIVARARALLAVRRSR